MLDVQTSSLETLEHLFWCKEAQFMNLARFANSRGIGDDIVEMNSGNGTAYFDLTNPFNFNAWGFTGVM
jgi:hypothetical protein